MANFIFEAFRDGVNNSMEKEFFNGYNEAANICMDTMMEKIDALNLKINEGEFLSKEEQFLMAQLNNLMKEMDKNLRNHQ